MPAAYKFARAQWPVIVGPLDDPQKHTLASEPIPTMYPEYYNQQRVQAEIDAIREKLLRTSFKSYCVSKIGGQAIYDDIVADPTDSLYQLRRRKV
jgi:hypothetical protein